MAQVQTDRANLILTINGAQSANTLKEMEARARDLRRLLQNLPVDSAEFRTASAELNKLNNRVKELKGGLAQAQAQTSLFGRAMQGALSVFSGISLAGIASSVLEYGKQLFGVSVSLDTLANKTRTVFGESEALIRAFAEKNAASIGLAKDQYVGLATAVGDLLIPMGFTQETAAALSVELVNQGGVLAEWSQGKVTAQEATEILNKALLGERDALNQLGIDIKDSLVQDELKKRGLQDLTGESKRQAEALVTLQLITQQSASANAAFATNVDSLTRRKSEFNAKIAEVSQSLGKLLAPAFSFIIDLGNKALTVFNSFTKGISNLFSGNFTKAIDYFTKGFSVEDLAAEATKAQGAAEGVMTTSGSGLATALGAGFDKEFARLLKNGERDTKKLADERKKALGNALKGVDVEFAKQELAALKLRQDGIIQTETQYGNVMISLQQQQLAAQLEVYRKFGQDMSKEAIELQKKLVEIETNRGEAGTIRSSKLAVPLGTLGQAGTGGAQSEVQPGLDSEQLGSGLEVQALRTKFQGFLFAELGFIIERDRLRSESAARQLQMLRAAGLQETEEYKRITDQKKDLDKSVEDNKADLLVFRQSIEEAGRQTFGAVIDFGIQMIGKDAAARKKYAVIIKGFQAGEVIVSGISEIQKIYAKYAAIPGGALIAQGEAIPAGIRTAVAVAKILATKFARGGFTGRGSGQPDETGHVPVGIAHAGEWYAPPWMVQHPQYAPTLHALEQVRQKGFAEGGFTTTPSVNIVPAGVSNAAAVGAADFAELTKEVRQWRTEMTAWQSRLHVSYGDIEEVGASLNRVRTDASF